MFDNLHEAHGVLVEETARAAKPGHDPVPISIVSVSESVDSQLVIFDGEKVSASSVVKRLRAAADHIEKQSS
jgi:allophanate hydrolase subunit 1